MLSCVEVENGWMVHIFLFGEGLLSLPVVTALYPDPFSRRPPIYLLVPRLEMIFLFFLAMFGYTHPLTPSLIFLLNLYLSWCAMGFHYYFVVR